MANQHTTHALTGLQRRSRVPAAEVRLLWEARGRIKVAENGCWLWQGAKSKDGYGNIWADGKSVLVHRFVYLLCVGEIESGTEVCHDCPGGDTPSCCNPAHLFPGTHTDNMRDAARKGRIKSRDSRGEKNPAAKLTAEKVLYIRRRAVELAGMKPTAMSRVIAAEVGVSSVNVRRVVRRLIWGHVA